MESIKTELFIHSNEEIPDSFIRFADIRPVVDRCTAIPGVKIYFKTSGQIVKICQPIEQETNIDINSFAHFYPNYEFNKPLHDLLSDEASSENFKLFPTFKNLYNENRFELFVNIYIRKQYLIELYDSDFIPNIILVIKVKILLPIKVTISSSSLPPEPLYLLPNIKSLFFDNLISSSKYFGSKE